MSEDKSDFILYTDAKKIVGNVIEEEHIQEANRRILTVYDLKGKELCWFDAEEVMSKVIDPNKKVLSEQAKEDQKIAAVEYILNHIPSWVMESV